MSAIASRECVAINGHQSSTTATACCQAGSKCRRRSMSSLTTPGCLVEKRGESEEAQPQRGRIQSSGSSSQRIKGNIYPVPLGGRDPRVQGTIIPQPDPQTSPVWTFFNMHATDSTIVISKISLQHIKCVNTSSLWLLHICKDT